MKTVWKDMRMMSGYSNGSSKASNVEKTGRGEVILMRCHSGEVLGEVDPKVDQEALCSLVKA
ncbi:hypothetical protein E2C01_007347 [Portunus trituberculatus]|uniref:Uncharacterized protein n=1 Tax=Portunus trituberculatus TaxID=210409 RepID=A0A5B7CYZ6_PORTR|nr:hypothetical protein [Portunus trituberculatus]